MLKVVAWSAVAATTGAAALFVPIDPTVLKTVGLLDGEANVASVTAQADGRSSGYPLKIVSRHTKSGDKAAIRVVGTPTVSPYQANSKPEASRSSRVQQLAIAAAPRLITPPAAATPPTTPTSVAMVRKLQDELRRVGCYHSRIDGDWGPASRFAMAAFTKSVNAALPTDRPDVVLLTLVRRHTGKACGGNRATPAPTITTAAPSQQIGTQRISGWRARVAPAAVLADGRLAQSPYVRSPNTQVGRTQAARAQPATPLISVPRIIRGDGVLARRAIIVPPSDAGATTIVASGSRSRTFDQGRMALGVIPAPRAAGPLSALQGDLFGQRSARRPLIERRRYRKPRPRARRTVKRRRYRRSRSSSWRKNAFNVDN